MTTKIRVIGASLSLAAGTLALINGLIFMIVAVTGSSFGLLENILFRIPILAAGGLYLLGGMFLIKDLTFGGWFVLVGAAVQLLTIFIAYGLGWGPPVFAEMMGAIHPLQLKITPDPITGSFFFIDPALGIIGGLLGMVVGEKWTEYDQSPST